MPRISDIVPEVLIGTNIIKEPTKYNFVNDENFGKILSEFQKINQKIDIDEQFKYVTDISLKYSICWDHIMELVNMGILQYDDDYLCLTPADNINLLKASDFQT